MVEFGTFTLHRINFKKNYVFFLYFLVFLSIDAIDAVFLVYLRFGLLDKLVINLLFLTVRRNSLVIVHTLDLVVHAALYIRHKYIYLPIKRNLIIMLKI